MFMMNSQGVEISIAGCVAEMVRDPNPMPFFWFFLFVILSIINYREQRLRGAQAMAKEKHPTGFLSTPAPGKKPSTQAPLVRDQPHTSHAK